jgi:hypothetical protein
VLAKQVRCTHEREVAGQTLSLSRSRSGTPRDMGTFQQPFLFPHSGLAARMMVDGAPRRLDGGDR